MTRFEAAALHARSRGLAWHVTENPYRVGDTVHVAYGGRETIATVVRATGRVSLTVEGPFPGRRRRIVNISRVRPSRGQIMLERVNRNEHRRASYAEAMTGDPSTWIPCGAV